MLRPRGSRWSKLVLITLIGGILLPAFTGIDAMRTAEAVMGKLPAGIDVALDRVTTASSAAARTPASKAVDGDPATYWCPVASRPSAHITITLTSRAQLNGTGITWVGRAPTQYNVLISDNGITWRTLPGTPWWDEQALTSFVDVTRRGITARFIRLQIVDRASLPCVAAFRVYSSPTSAAQLTRGVDLSTLRALEAAGKSFADEAGTRPAEEILRDHDMNLVRLRLWVQPPNDFNGLADVKAMALRIKRANMRFLLDLHYSDFWADPEHQATPAAWQGQDLETLAITVHNYTRSVVSSLVAQGTPPDIIQIGNEVKGGMLWPLGKIDVDGQQRWDGFTMLLKAGIAGAREGAAGQPKPAIMVHVNSGGDQAGTQWFYDRIMRDYGVDFDMIGLSYYRYWNGSLSDARRNLDNLATRYGKPILIVETAAPWTLENYDDQVNIVNPDLSLPTDYPVSPLGQALFVRDLLSVVARTPNKLGLGVVYWEPAWIPGISWGPGEDNLWENQTLFDPEGRALESIDAMQVQRR